MDIVECYIKGKKAICKKHLEMLKKRHNLGRTNLGLGKNITSRGSRERSTIKPFWRPYDNFIENFTSLNAKRDDIL